MSKQIKQQSEISKVSMITVEEFEATEEASGRAMTAIRKGELDFSKMKTSAEIMREMMKYYQDN